MNTNIKLDKKKGATKASLKRTRVRKPKSNPLPIILVSLTAFILLIVVILLATGNKTENQTVANTPKEQSPLPKSEKAAVKKVAPAKMETAKPSKEKTASSGPELVGYGANTLKPSEDGGALEPGSDTEPVEEKAEPVEENVEAEAAPTAEKTEESSTVSNLPPKEQSIANLKKIGQQYKVFADNRQGHMPIELYQLDLNDSDKVSPYTNSRYVMTQEGKGAPLKDSLESIIVREAKAVNGKYLCLLGNGEVRELDAGSVEE